MNKQPVKITIEAPIGCGKTALAVLIHSILSSESIECDIHDSDLGRSADDGSIEQYIKKSAHMDIILEKLSDKIFVDVITVNVKNEL